MSSKSTQQGYYDEEPTEAELRAALYEHLHAAMEAAGNDDWDAYEDALTGARSYGRRLAPGWSR